MASNSSMKMMAGEFFSASSKAFRRLLSDSPASLLMISGPEHAKTKRNQMLRISSTQLRFTVDQIEEGARFISHGTSDQRLACTGGSIQKDTARRLYSDGLEQLRMSKRKLHHLLDLGQLLPHSTDVVVTNSVQCFFFFLDTITTFFRSLTILQSPPNFYVPLA